MHPTKKLDVEFVKQWKKFSHPLKAAIKKELDKGTMPRQAVQKVFLKYKVKEKLKILIMKNIMKAHIYAQQI